MTSIYDKLEVIGLSGKLGTGKNYIAEEILPLILPKKNTLYIAFADHLKITVSAQSRTKLSEFYGSKTPEIRTLLQNDATKNGRNKFGQDIWLNVLENWLHLFMTNGTNIERVIITDCRFKNEADWINSFKNKILIRIHAPDRNEERLQKESKKDNAMYMKISTHISETALDDYSDAFDLCVDNSKSQSAKIIKNILYNYYTS